MKTRIDVIKIPKKVTLQSVLIGEKLLEQRYSEE